MHNRYPHGMVAAGHPATAEAGAEILRSGGNAVDAAIAAMCTAFTAESVLTAAGGGGFMLLRHPDGIARLYDGFARMPERSPAAVPDMDFRAIPIDFGDMVQTFHIGRASIATPSLLAMLFAAHAREGYMPMRELLQPAIQAAREGIPLNALQASFIGLLAPILTAEPHCHALYAPGKNLLSEGEAFRNPDLASILELLAIDGIDEMYRGDVGRAIANACISGGLLTHADLTRPQVNTRKPLTLKVLDGELLTNPPPSSGGGLVAFNLHILEALHHHLPDAPPAVLLAESMRATSLARSRGFDDHVHEQDIADEFLAAAHLRQWRAAALARLEAGSPDARAQEPKNRHGSTTHISVVDAAGLAVALTASNGEGSGIVVPGTGIHLNNMLGEEDINPGGFHRLPGGAILPSMMAPSIFVRDGRPRLVLGSGGSNRLRGAILQVLYRHVVEGVSIEAAVQAPRLHNEGDILDVEPDCLCDHERARLVSLGWHIREWDRPSVYFGGVHAISLYDDGLSGAGDPRRGGCVAWA